MRDNGGQSACSGKHDEAPTERISSNLLEPSEGPPRTLLLKVKE